MSRFKGKTVMITGAARGFGALAAKMFAAEGAKVVLGDVSDDVENVAKALGGVWAKCDVSKEDQVKNLVALAAETGDGRLDVALNNAGIVHDLTKLEDVSIETFNKQINVNAGGCFLCMKHQLPIMVAQGGGAIVNVASVAGLGSAPGLSAYAAAKHAVVGMTKTVADEYARHKIRVNAICPSFTDTDMADTLRKVTVDGAGEKIDPKFLSRIPMRRIAEPEEMVQAMLWAAAPENSFMTGQAIAIDGGLTAT